MTGLRSQYREQGFLHVKGLFGSGRVASARRAAEHLPDWIRRRSRNRNVQRIGHLQSCAAVEDPAWIRKFYGHPALQRLLGEVFGADIRPAPDMSRDLQITALLVEPLDCWWSTGLHRDYRDFPTGIDVVAWRARFTDFRLFNQINIPLLADSSFWLIPGSHARDDLAREARMVRERDRYANCQSGRTSPERTEEYRRQLAEDLRECGAVNIVSAPGDFILYRSNMLHCGVYEPGVGRLTLHDAVYSSEWRRFVTVNLGRRPAAGRAALPPGAGRR